MNLQEFVETALVEIVVGVAAAKAKVKEHGGNVGSMRIYGDTTGLRIDHEARQIHLVEFDVALAESSSKESKGGIGVFLGSVGVGGQAASLGESSTHSRIKFSVPIVLPS